MFPCLPDVIPLPYLLPTLLHQSSLPPFSAQSWSKEVALDAQRWADACILLVHDNTTGRTVDAFGPCGQNIFVATQQVPWSASSLPQHPPSYPLCLCNNLFRLHISASSIPSVSPACSSAPSSRTLFLLTLSSSFSSPYQSFPWQVLLFLLIFFTSLTPYSPYYHQPPCHPTRSLASSSPASLPHPPQSLKHSSVLRFSFTSVMTVKQSSHKPSIR